MGRVFPDNQEKESESGDSLEGMRESTVGHEPTQHPEERGEDGIVRYGPVPIAVREQGGPEHYSERSERDSRCGLQHIGRCRSGTVTMSRPYGAGEYRYCQELVSDSHHMFSLLTASSLSEIFLKSNTKYIF